MNLGRTYLDALDAARALVSDPEIAARWGDASALARMSVGALAGHLARAALTVRAALDRPEPDVRTTMTASGYFAQLVDTPDLDAPLNVGIRERAEAAAASGHAALIETWDDTRATVEEQLREVAPDRAVEVFQGVVLPLDEYLRTRLVELVVHADDLARSVGRDGHPMPEAAVACALDTLVGIARLRHGDLAVVRALARRERDTVDALRVL